MFTAIFTGFAGCSLLGVHIYNYLINININNKFKGKIIEICDALVVNFPDNNVWMIDKKFHRTDDETKYIGNFTGYVDFVYNPNYLNNFNYVGTKVIKQEQYKRGVKHFNNLYLYIEGNEVKLMHENMTDLIEYLVYGKCRQLNDWMFVLGVGLIMNSVFNLC